VYALNNLEKKDVTSAMDLSNIQFLSFKMPENNFRERPLSLNQMKNTMELFLQSANPIYVGISNEFDSRNFNVNTFISILPRNLIGLYLCEPRGLNVDILAETCPNLWECVLSTKYKQWKEHFFETFMQILCVKSLHQVTVMQYPRQFKTKLGPELKSTWNEFYGMKIFSKQSKPFFESFATRNACSVSATHI